MRMLNEPSYFTKSIDASGVAQTDYSEMIDLGHAFGYSIHFIATRTAAVLAGNVITQKSNDGATWIDVTTTALNDVASQAGAFEVTDVMYRYLRIKITTATGKVDLAINLTTKGV